MIQSIGHCNVHITNIYPEFHTIIIVDCMYLPGDGYLLQVANHPFQLFSVSTGKVGGHGPALKSAAGPEKIM